MMRTKHEVGQHGSNGGANEVGRKAGLGSEGERKSSGRSDAKGPRAVRSLGDGAVSDLGADRQAGLSRQDRFDCAPKTSAPREWEVPVCPAPALPDQGRRNGARVGVEAAWLSDSPPPFQQHTGPADARSARRGVPRARHAAQRALCLAGCGCEAQEALVRPVAVPVAAERLCATTLDRIRPREQLAGKPAHLS